MPARLIDGEAIWSSKKLRAANKLDELSVLLYCWLLPIAEGNGVFEFDIDNIYAKSIQYQLSSLVTKPRLEAILSIYQDLGLLYIWKRFDRVYGFWTNIDKRLPKQNQKLFRYKFPSPSMDRVARYMNSCKGRVIEILRTDHVFGCTNPGEPCTEVVRTSRQLVDTEEDNASEVLGLGLGLGEVEEKKTEMALADKLKNIIYEKTGKAPKLPEYLVTEFRKRVGTEKDKLAAFREYLTSNPDSEYPLHGFLDTEVEAAHIAPAVVGGIVQNEEVLDIAAKVFEISDLAVTGKSLAALSALIEKGHSKHAILLAFRYYFSKLDAFDQKQAVRNFFEKGGAEPIIKSMSEYVAKQEALSKRIDAMSATPRIIAPRSDSDDEDGVEVDF